MSIAVNIDLIFPGYGLGWLVVFVLLRRAEGLLAVRSFPANQWLQNLLESCRV